MNSPGAEREPPPASGVEQAWMVLVDPSRSDQAGESPPVEAMIGAWPLRPDGTALPFQPNPDYRPPTPDSPTDLVDAAAQLVIAGRAAGESVLWALRDSVHWLAVDETGTPEVDNAPDGVPCVLVVTSGTHRDRVRGPRWRELTGPELAAVLPEQTDVMINVGGPAAMRLIGDVVRAAMTPPVGS